MSPLHQAGSRSPVRLVNEVRRCREARWFLEGDVPNKLRPPGTPVKRTDLYELESLRPWEAYKRRGRPRVVEHKWRVGRVELIDVLGALGYVETWEKQRDQRERTGSGQWIAVRKQLWTSRGLEIGKFQVDDRAGWTICIDPGARLGSRGRDLLEAWAPLLVERGEPGSYPAWLGSRPSQAGGVH